MEMLHNENLFYLAFLKKIASHNNLTHNMQLFDSLTLPGSSIMGAYNCIRQVQLGKN
jgi:hypothetical protein